MSSLDPFQVFTAHCDAWQVQGRLREPYGGGAAEFEGWRLMASGLSYAHLNAACVTDPALADIDRRTFLFLVHESPTFALGIMGALASRLRDYDERFGRFQDQA